MEERDRKALERLRVAHSALRDELGKIIVGQTDVVDQLLMAIFSRGHCLLVGVPGLAKTLLVSTLSRILSLDFKRIQFTPDLMPADITGTEIIQEDPVTRQRSFKFLRGPIFANIILADEINRTPPKTQAALLEAMQEHKVTAGGHTYTLDEPFFVLATQNPIEQEGTYPLPEAQLDRFMFMVRVDYPSMDEELDILRRTTSSIKQEVGNVLTAEEILWLQEFLRDFPVPPHVFDYVLGLVRATRVAAGEVDPRIDKRLTEFVREYVTWGAGPRAGQYLILGAKARAALDGRAFVDCSDVAAIAAPVLRHRIITNYKAEASGVTPDDVVKKLVELTPRPTVAKK
ncbi:MAG: MoxR-like ATPase [Armatimonadetes bacterium]|nr:MoxR-like ATPase [Armatimonadota bacterium]